MRRFEGRFALVTGGAKGIGLAVTERLAREGAGVAVFDREIMPSESQERVRGHGVPLLNFVGDVRDRQALSQAMVALSDGYGRIDVIVNDAAIVPIAGVCETSDALWDKTMAVNAHAPLVVVQEAMGLLHLGASIVNVASGSAFMASSSQIAYAASKSALVALSRNIAFELGPRGIRSNVVAPGPTSTHLLQGLSDESRKERQSRIPLGRFGEPSEIAAAVAFLASEDASYVNGTVLMVDGGLYGAGIR